MKSEKPLNLCCWRFKESVKEGIFIKADSFDETEWFMPDSYHIYFCPYCGSNIKGKGFGRPPTAANEFTSQEYNLLREIILKRQPDLEYLIGKLGVSSITGEQRENMRCILADELVEFGLDKEDEPNKYGLIIECLIDKLFYYSDMT